MKNSIIGSLGRGIAITTFATLGVVGVAQADWRNNYSEAGISEPGYFSNFGASGMTHEFDQSQYDKVNTGPLSSTLWAPKRGAQGPMRDDDEASRMAAQRALEIERSLGPVGGRGTP